MLIYNSKYSDKTFGYSDDEETTNKNITSRATKKVTSISRELPKKQLSN